MWTFADAGIDLLDLIFATITRVHGQSRFILPDSNHREFMVKTTLSIQGAT